MLLAAPIVQGPDDDSLLPFALQAVMQLTEWQADKLTCAAVCPSSLTVNSVSSRPTGRLTLATALIAACCAAAALVASSNSCSSVLSSACKSVGKTAPLLLALKGGTAGTAFSAAPPPDCRADLEPGWTACSHHAAQHCPAAAHKML